MRPPAPRSTSPSVLGWSGRFRRRRTSGLQVGGCWCRPASPAPPAAAPAPTADSQPWRTPARLVWGWAGMWATSRGVEILGRAHGGKCEGLRRGRVPGPLKWRAGLTQQLQTRLGPTLPTYVAVDWRVCPGLTWCCGQTPGGPPAQPCSPLLLWAPEPSPRSLHPWTSPHFLSCSGRVGRPGWALDP